MSKIKKVNCQLSNVNCGIKLQRQFYTRNTLKVAKELLGKYLVRKIDPSTPLRVGKIVETEAYMGPDDLASHASRGRTKRTEIMFGKSGIAYIYLIYGMYYCFNIVTEKEGYPAAVLIRAAETLQGTVPAGTVPCRKLASGPGKLCRYFKIDKNLNGEDLITSSKLWIEDRGVKIKKSDMVFAERVGVDYAKHCANYPWRFYIRNNPLVSKNLSPKNE